MFCHSNGKWMQLQLKEGFLFIPWVVEGSVSIKTWRSWHFMDAFGREKKLFLEFLVNRNLLTYDGSHDSWQHMCELVLCIGKGLWDPGFPFCRLQYLLPLGTSRFYVHVHVWVFVCASLFLPYVFLFLLCISKIESQCRSFSYAIFQILGIIIHMPWNPPF